MIWEKNEGVVRFREALPFIQKLSGKTIVIKYGGNAMLSEALRKSAACDIVFLSALGIKIILVHGGGPEIDCMLKKVNIKPRFIDGLRYTDEETMDIVQQVLCGKVNKDLVSLIDDAGGKAVGICGLDRGMIKATRRRTGADCGLVGEIAAIEPEIINDMLGKGYIPVIAGIAKAMDGGSVYNINADTAAAKLAAAVGASKLILLTDVPGVMKDKKNEDTLISHIKMTETNALRSSGIISGGMIPKIDCCMEALQGGVEEAHIIDGRAEHSIIIKLLTDKGIGTMFTA
ncbi:MAG TPA: acetylglutamate kinase [Bacillota bacterium]|nr:acetylglutamate kinase [Bacillota bacterium]